MFCSNCGAQNQEEAVFCRNCGFHLKNENPDYAADGYGLEKRIFVPEGERMPEEKYKPIGMWGYFGYQLLFAVPLVGFVFLIVFAFGGTKNVNVKNFARSYFCMLIVWILVLVLILAAGGSHVLLRSLL